MAYRIVTFDGGGIRGLISALMLKRLQEDVDFIGRVQLFAGTSTGSFIALSMAQEASAANIRNVLGLYEQDGPKIFTPSVPSPFAGLSIAGRPTGGWLGTRLKELTRSLDHDWRDWENIFHVAYTNAGLRATLDKHYGQHGPQTLGGLGTEVLVNTVQLWNAEHRRWSPFEITRHSTPGLSLTEAALCSGAAPMYFPPFEPTTHPLGYCTDGGLFANNPAMGALTYALRQGHPLPHIRLLAIGTGTVSQGMPRLGNPGNWGALSWSYPYPTQAQPAMPLLAAMMDTSAMAVDDQVHHLLGHHYRRLNVSLETAISLDDASPAAMAAMHAVVDKLVGSPAWARLVEWTTRDFLGDGAT